MLALMGHMSRAMLEAKRDAVARIRLREHVEMTPQNSEVVPVVNASAESVACN